MQASLLLFIMFTLGLMSYVVRLSLILWHRIASWSIYKPCCCILRSLSWMQTTQRYILRKISYVPLSQSHVDGPYRPSIFCSLFAHRFEGRDSHQSYQRGGLRMGREAKRPQRFVTDNAQVNDEINRALQLLHLTLSLKSFILPLR
jgi:hypothetical protein